jgi:hypothetical protein
MKKHTTESLEKTLEQFNSKVEFIKPRPVDKKKIYGDTQDKLTDLCLAWVKAEQNGLDLTELDQQITICEHILERLHKIMEQERKAAA